MVMVLVSNLKILKIVLNDNIGVTGILNLYCGLKKWFCYVINHFLIPYGPIINTLALGLKTQYTTTNRVFFLVFFSQKQQKSP